MRVFVRFHRIASSRACLCAASRLHAPSHRTAATCGINGSARAARRRPRARVVAFDATGRARARSAAGITWTSRTLKAGWAARGYHTSLVDAAAAIYVIGGVDAWNTYFQDVWASTDGGARAGCGQGGVGGYTGWVLSRVLRGY